MFYYYTYVLKSNKDGKFYTGYTKNLKLRLEQHDAGLVNSTKNRRPLKLVYLKDVVVNGMPLIVKSI